MVATGPHRHRADSRAVGDGPGLEVDLPDPDVGGEVPRHRHPDERGAVGGHRQRPGVEVDELGGQVETTDLHPLGEVDDRNEVVAAVGDVEHRAVGAHVESAGLRPTTIGASSVAVARLSTSTRFWVGLVT